MPVLTRPALAQPSFALGLVFVQKLWRSRGGLLKLAARLVVLPRVPLAPAGGNHGDFVGSAGAVLALQLNALGAGLVVDAAPVVVSTPTRPVPPTASSADPVLKHLGGQTLACADQLLDGVDAGAVAV